MTYVGFAEFVDTLRSLPDGDPCDPDMMVALRECRIRPEELARSVVWNEERYTRHLVYNDDRYQVILLGWGIGQVSPIHDHAGQRCWMIVEQGRLQITDFQWKEGEGPPLLLHDEVVGGKGDDLYLDRCACVHRIANLAEWQEPAMSLHVYSRPFDSCGVYCLDTGRREACDLRFDSVGPLADLAAV